MITQKTLNEVINYIILAAKQGSLASKVAGDTIKVAFNNAAECPPGTVGMSNDVTSVVRCGLKFTGSLTSEAMSSLEIVATSLENSQELAKEAIATGIELDLYRDSKNAELRQMGREMQDLIREERELRLGMFLAADEFSGAQLEYDAAVQRGYRKLRELELLRKRWAGQITSKRYSDMAYRIFENDALRKYRQQFDLAQQYVYLTAAAYHYETNLARTDPASGDKFLREISGERTLGAARQALDWTVVPIAGSHGLADPLAKMRDNFAALKGQMGFSNPQDEANAFSLRKELFRLRDAPESNAKWRLELQRLYTPDIYADPRVAALAKRPPDEAGPQPGLVIPFNTTIQPGLNYFGWPLGPGESSYDTSQFATKIANVGIWFKGYDTERLANTPRVYLLPAGNDVVRPRGAEGTLRYWNVNEQLLPVPQPIREADQLSSDWIARIDGLNGRMFEVKPFARLRAYPLDLGEEPEASEFNTDTRLIGRSVWNTRWMLVIPGSTMLADPEMAVSRFIEDVDDIYLYFQTYAYQGVGSPALSRPGGNK
jgi:hypothetical protein